MLCSANKGNLGVPQLPGQGCSFHSFRTNTYKLSFMETPSGIKVRRTEHDCLYIGITEIIHIYVCRFCICIQMPVKEYGSVIEK